MKMNSCEWRPDTCDCVLEYEWDEDLPLEERTFSVKSIQKKCKHHDKTDKDKDHFEVILEENRRKNLAVKALLGAVGEGEIELQNIEFEFDKDRNVILSHYPHKKPWKDEHKTKIEAAFVSFGGKVKLG